MLSGEKVPEHVDYEVESMRCCQIPVFFGGAYFYLQSKRVSFSRKFRVNTQKYRLWRSKEIVIWNN